MADTYTTAGGAFGFRVLQADNPQLAVPLADPTFKLFWLAGDAGSNSAQAQGTATGNTYTVGDYGTYWNFEAPYGLNYGRPASGTVLTVEYGVVHNDTVISTNDTNLVFKARNSGELRFDVDGDLTVPGDILAQEGNDLNLVVYNPTVEGTPGGVTFSVQNRDVMSDSKTTQFDVGPADIVLTTDFAGARHEWTFDSTGTLILPSGGDIVRDGASVLGSGSANTGNFTFNADTITNGNGLILETDRGTLAIGTQLEVPGVAGHLHISFNGSNINPPAGDLFLGDDYNFVKLPGYELDPATYGAEIGTNNRGFGPQNVVVSTVDELVPLGGVWRFFIDPNNYLNLGSLVSIGDTVTTSWGTPITATITDIVEDPGLWWIIAVDQDITAGFSGGDTVSIGKSGNSYTWRFGTDGVLTFPGGNMTMGNIQGSEGIWGGANVQIGTLSQGISGASVLEWVDKYQDATSVAAVAVNSLFAANTGAVQIITGAAGPVPEYMWTFDKDGALTLAKDIVVAANDGHIYIDNSLSSATSIRWVNTYGDSEMFRVYSDSRQDVNNELFQAGFNLITEPGFYITTTANVSGIGNNPADDHTWTFRTDGGLRFPDGSIQTTAYTVDSTVWVQDFETVDGAPTDVVAMATAVEYLTNGDIVALFDHQEQSPGSSRYSSIGRFNANGTKLWSMRFAGSQYTDGWGLAVDNADGFIYVAGQTNNDGQPYAAATLTKLNQADGALEWSKIYNAGYTNVNTVVDVAADGNVAVVGYSSNGTDDQIVTTKIDKSDGSVVWSRALDGQGNEEAYGMAVGPAGEVVAVGYMDHIEYPGPVRTILTLTAVPASDPAWTNDLLGVTVGGVSYDITFTAGVPTFSNIVDTTGNYYVGDQLSYIGASQIGGGADMRVNVATTTQEDLSNHMLVVKYDSTGTIQWQRAVQVEAGFDCNGADADIDSTGNIYVCGNFDYNDGVDKNAMIIIKFDSSGVKQWSRKVVGGCNDFATSIVVGPDDCLYLSAVTGDNGAGDFSLVVAKYNLDGTVAWQRLLDNTTTWTFVGDFWFDIGGGSNLAVRDGYVAVAGGYADPGGTVPHAIVAQIDAEGTVFAVGNYDFRAASFSGLLDSSASNITVTDADKTASNYEFAGVDPVSPMTDYSNFLVGTLYSSGIGGSVDRLVSGGNSIVLGTNGLVTFPDIDGVKTLWGAVDEDFYISTTRTDPGEDADLELHAADDLRLYAHGDELELSANSSVRIYTDTSDNGYEWQFGQDGNLSLPQGSTIGETETTTVITPPGAAAGQSLVLRGTSPTGITSDHPGGFTDGDTIIITVNPNNSISVTGTIDYTFTGDFGVGGLGTATTGTLTFSNEGTKQLTWTIPVSSAMTTFTFTITNSSGIGIGGMTALTLTRTGSSEASHIHLVAGNPATTDIYLGDDDQYVKIEKDGGDVVIGTDANTNHWRFGDDGDLVLPAGKTIRNTEGVDLLADATSPQYGYFNEMVNPADGNQVTGEAVAMDSDGNSYVSYSYYSDNDNRNYGGVVKFDSTGEKLWSVDISSQNSNAEYPEICSLEYTTTPGGAVLIALGSYYDDDIGKDIAFMYAINPETGAVGASLLDAEMASDDGMELKDGVVGIDNSSDPFAVVVGSTYDQKLTKTLTPLAGSTVDKLYFSWSEVNAADVPNGAQLTTQTGGYYGFMMNAADVNALPAGSSGYGLSLTISSTESGSYVITRANGWGGEIYGWSTPVTLTVLGNQLGGVNGVNDMTFDFDKSVFNDNSNNINAAVSNIQGTPVSDVYCSAFNGKDWSTEIGNALTFDYNLNDQAFIARFGNNAWSKSLGTTSWDRMNSVVVDNAGNTYAAGYVWNGSRGSLVVKYNISGVEQWAVYIDPSNNTGNELSSIDLLADGNLITVDEEGVVTKLDKDDGSIIWQVQADTDPSWDGDFKGTATPDGDYIIVNYESDDYTMYVMRVSGVDGSSMWNKRITRTYGGQTGEIYAEDDFDAQYIDCNDTYLTIGATSEHPDTGDKSGLVISFPIDGNNVDGTYGQYVVSTQSMNWTTETTTSTAATVASSPTNVQVVPSSPSKTNSTITVNQTTIGGGVLVSPVIATWTSPNNNVWRIENYNGGAAVSYNGGSYDAKWFDVANSPGGDNNFRGAVIEYHAFISGRGTIIGTIHLANDWTQESATHTEHLSGNSGLQFVTLWDCNNNRGQLYFKMTDGSNENIMIQWTAKIFYGDENHC